MSPTENGALDMRMSPGTPTAIAISLPPQYGGIPDINAVSSALYFFSSSASAPNHSPVASFLKQNPRSPLRDFSLARMLPISGSPIKIRHLVMPVGWMANFLEKSTEGLSGPAAARMRDAKAYGCVLSRNDLSIHAS